MLAFYTPDISSLTPLRFIVDASERSIQAVAGLRKQVYNTSDGKDIYRRDQAGSAAPRFRQNRRRASDRIDRRGRAAWRVACARIPWTDDVYGPRPTATRRSAIAAAFGEICSLGRAPLFSSRKAY